MGHYRLELIISVGCTVTYVISDGNGFFNDVERYGTGELKGYHGVLVLLNDFERYVAYLNPRTYAEELKTKFGDVLREDFKVVVEVKVVGEGEKIISEGEKFVSKVSTPITKVVKKVFNF